MQSVSDVSRPSWGERSALTRQGKDLVTNVDGRIVLAAVQRILSPGAQKFLHGDLSGTQCDRNGSFTTKDGREAWDQQMKKAGGARDAADGGRRTEVNRRVPPGVARE